MYVAEHECRPLAGRQHPHRCSKRGMGRTKFGQLAWRRSRSGLTLEAWSAVVHELSCRSVPKRCRGADTAPRGDPVRPYLELFGIAELVQVPKYFQRNFLGDVIDVLALSHDSSGSPSADAQGVLGNLFSSLMIAALRLRHELRPDFRHLAFFDRSLASP